MKKIVNDKTERMSSKSFYLSEIQNFNEHTKWDEIVKSANVDIVKDNFLAIIEYRNDVMHAHNISSKRYYEAKKMFTNCIVALEKEIKLLIESSEYCENSQEELLALLENLTNDHPVEVGEGLYLLTR